MQSAFGAGFLWGTPVGGAPVMFASLQSCSLDASFDQKILYGQKSFAQEMARGKGKLDFKATVGRIDPTLFNAIFWGGATATGQISTALGESTTLAAPGGATTIAVMAANASTFRTDLGVFDPAVGRFMTQRRRGRRRAAISTRSIPPPAATPSPPPTSARWSSSTTPMAWRAGPR
jgi:hypothetical protein